MLILISLILMVPRMNMDASIQAMIMRFRHNKSSPRRMCVIIPLANAYVSYQW